MAIAFQRESDGLIVYTVSGRLGIAEMDAIEHETDTLYQERSNWKVLVLLQDFAGWTAEDGWGNTRLIDETDENVDRMALVGPPKWRDQVEMFTLKGMRPIEIEYFSDESQARAWLGAA